MSQRLKMFQLYDNLPSKFIAIYNDGSGCDIFYEVSNGLYNKADGYITDVSSDWFMDAGYIWFIALPDNFKVWENKE